MKSPVETKTLTKATVNAQSEQAEPAIRSCTGANTCDKTSTVVLVDKAKNALDSEFMTFDANTLVLKVEPTKSSQIGTYTMQMTQTVKTGHDPIVMDVVTVVVDCIIEKINSPQNPGTQTYNLMAAAKDVTLTPAFLQYPPCDYAVTNNIQWTIPTIADDTNAITKVNDYKIRISSSKLTIHGEYTLTVKNSVTYTDRGTAQAWSPSVSFKVDIKDPCKTSTITQITLTDMTVVNGQSKTQNFAEVVDSAETTYGTDSCGERVYQIVKQGDSTYTPVTFARVEAIVANQNYRIVSDYSLEANEGTHNLALYVTMKNYPVTQQNAHPTLLSNFKLTISPAVCDCKLLNWINP